MATAAEAVRRHLVHFEYRLHAVRSHVQLGALVLGPHRGVCADHDHFLIFAALRAAASRALIVIVDGTILN